MNNSKQENIMELIQWHCDKCGNTWWPRSRKNPKACPECNNRRHHHPVEKEETEYQTIDED